MQSIGIGTLDDNNGCTIYSIMNEDDSTQELLMKDRQLWIVLSETPVLYGITKQDINKWRL